MARRKKYKKNGVSDMVLCYGILIITATVMVFLSIVSMERVAIINFIMDNTTTIAVVLFIILLNQESRCLMN